MRYQVLRECVNRGIAVDKSNTHWCRAGRLRDAFLPPIYVPQPQLGFKGGFSICQMSVDAVERLRNVHAIDLFRTQGDPCSIPILNVCAVPVHKTLSFIFALTS